MRKTTEIMAISGHDDEMITAGELTELRFIDRNNQVVQGISTRSHKILHSLVNNAGPQITKASERFTIDLSAVNHSHLSKEDLEATIGELAGTVICIDTETRRGSAKRYGSFLSDVVVYDEETSQLEYEFSPLMRSIFQNSNHWAALSTRALYAFESGYGIRLYEMITLRENLKYKREETFTINELRQRFGVQSGKLKTWQTFKLNVLEKAIREVNLLSGAVVSYVVIKRGRKIDRVTLSWRIKDADERDLTSDLLDRTRNERNTFKKTAFEREQIERKEKRKFIQKELEKQKSLKQTDIEDFT
jgi:hypothetical protein